MTGKQAADRGEPLLRRLGRFEIGAAQRAEGALREYVGRDTESGESVLVTMYQREGEDTDSRFRKYRRHVLENQLEVSARLDHPNILRVLAISSEDEPDYIVTEHPGDTLPLSRLIEIRDELGLPRALRIGCAIAAAVDHAHRNEVVHCDLQPRNILVAPDDSIKLTGFALATQLDTDERTALVSFGSALYLAPEQIRGGEVTAQTDVFALGVTLYELLTGTHPFISNVVPAIAHKIVGKAHTQMSKLRPEIPPVLDRIIDRALKKHPAGRYQSAIDMMGDLSLVLDEIAPAEERVSDVQRRAQLRGVGFFDEFTDAEIMDVIRISAWIEAGTGEVIVNEGDYGDSFFVIVEGTVSVEKDGVFIDTLKRGDCFGEIGFITHNNRTASVLAKSDILLMEVRSNLVRRIPTSAQVRFQRAFLEIMATRLTRATERIATLSAGATR